MEIVQIIQLSKFNKNRSCIEIDMGFTEVRLRDSLIRTEVVLKFSIASSGHLTKSV